MSEQPSNPGPRPATSAEPAAAPAAASSGGSSGGPSDRSGGARLSVLQLEKIALGEASPAQPLDEAEQARLQALRESDAQILARYPAAQQAEQIAARVAKAQAGPVGQRARSSPRLWLPVLASVASVLVVVVWTSRPRVDPHGSAGGIGSTGGPDVDVITAKGGPTATRLRLYRQGQAQAEPLVDGALAQSGDLVQLAFVAGSARYGVLLSIDGRGGVTVHFPAGSDQATAPSTALSDPQSPLSPAGERTEVRLPQAFRLDDAPRFERFFLVTADEAHRDALRLADVVDRARRLARDPSQAERAELPDLPAGLQQQSLRVRKDAR